eukprot:3962561-Pyramimonas_sp.AAC.1
MDVGWNETLLSMDVDWNETLLPTRHCSCPKETLRSRGVGWNGTLLSIMDLSANETAPTAAARM